MLATICIPTVHRLQFLCEALESAASQSFDNYQILVSVNSTEPGYHHQVERVVEEAKLRHRARAIRIVKPPRFLHIAEHTNFMVEQATGDYLCYLADDDRMEPSYLETLVALLQEHEDAGFALCGFLIIDEKGTTHRGLSAKDAQETHLESVEEGFIPHSALARLALWNALMLPCSLFRRTLLAQFPFESGHEAPDRDFWLRVADAPGSIGGVYTRAPLLNYRHHKHQYTKFSRASQSDLIRTLERCHHVAEAEPSLHNQVLARSYAKLGKALLDEGNRAGSWQALLVALSKNAFDWRIYRFVLQAAVPAPALNCLRRLRDGRGGSKGRLASRHLTRTKRRSAQKRDDLHRAPTGCAPPPDRDRGRHR
jgi:Glycosyl transferase family 2